MDRQSNRPRLLVLTTTLPAQRGDGTPEFVLDLAMSLSDGFDVTIVAPRVPGALRFETLSGMAIERFDYFFPRWQGLADGAILPSLKADRWRYLEILPLVLSLLWKAFRAARRIDAQVIHAHWLLPSGVVARLIKQVLGIPYVVTAHGADAYALRGRLFRSVKRWVMRGASTVAPVNADMAKLLGIDPQQIGHSVVPMGVDERAIRAVSGPPDPQLGHFLFVGRLVPKKGVDLFLHALTQVDSARALIVGDGPEMSRLTALAVRLRLDGRVVFAGSLPRAEVIKEMAKAQALIVPSRVEDEGDRDGVPVVLAEALAVGTPAIVASLPGMDQLVAPGMNGIVFDPGSVESLATALQTAMDEATEIRRWPVGRGEGLPEVLRLESTRDRYREFLEKAINGSRPRGRG